MAENQNFAENGHADLNPAAENGGEGVLPLVQPPVEPPLLVQPPVEPPLFVQQPFEQPNPNLLDGKHVLLVATGHPSAEEFYNIFGKLVLCNAEVAVVLSEDSLKFISRRQLSMICQVFCDVDQTPSDDRSDELSQLLGWADVLVIAPLNFTHMAKVARGFCDNLVTEVCSHWPYAPYTGYDGVEMPLKPAFFFVPMSPFGWPSLGVVANDDIRDAVG